VPAAEGLGASSPLLRRRRHAVVLEARVADEGAPHASALKQRALEWKQQQQLVEPAGQVGRTALRIAKGPHGGRDVLDERGLVGPSRGAAGGTLVGQSA